MGDDAEETWPSSSSNSVPSLRFRWHVFLSFRGEDTRENFTERLYTELVRNGIKTFRDDEGLERGDEISPNLLKAIEESASSIAVISRNYANSKWCLEELAKIVDSKLLLLPVFFDVDPSDVRRQKGPFEEDFRKLELQVEAEKVSRWRKAMAAAGNISGWDSRLWEETELIKSLVKRVLTKMSNTPLGVAKYPVGLNSRRDELLERLDIKVNDIKILGIYGMGGIGKTTLAKALYNKLAIHFKNHSFISDVRETAQKSNGLLLLQSKLIGDFKLGNGPLKDITEGHRIIKKTIDETASLIVLDDVDNADQIQALVGQRDMLCPGSRIIITTRNKEVLLGTICDEVYEAQQLYFTQALQLFSYHAFGREEPVKGFEKISEQVVEFAGGLPLALEVFGSFLFYKKKMEDWHDALEKLRRVPPGELEEVLRISYNGLDEQGKSVFLDLACFFVNMKLKREDAIDIFKGCGRDAETTITDLTAKSLIKVIDGNVLWMHDQLRDMGRQIVVRESYGDLGKRSRLWDHNEVVKVLKNEMGTRSIEGIALDLREKCDLSPETKFKRRLITYAIAYLKRIYKKCCGHSDEKDGRSLYSKSFQPMINLRLLRINYTQLHGNFKLIPAELKWLQWKGCPLEVLPSQFWPRDIAVLDLSESQIRLLWTRKWWGPHRNKMANKLLVLDLHDCFFLKEIPDLSGLVLEKLILDKCFELTKVHKSVGDMSTLTYLSLKECRNLVKFPSDVSGLKHLEKLILSWCSKLRELPEDMSGLKSLKELLIDHTAIEMLPNSIFRLKNLQVFKLDDCESLKVLPEAIGNLSSLTELSLDGCALQEIPDSIRNLTMLEKLCLKRCRSLTSVPDSIGSLKSLIELGLDKSSIRKLPASVGSLYHLKCLTVSHCRGLTELPSTIGGLSSLQWLCLQGTPISEVPSQVGSLINLEKLDMGNCELRSLPHSIGNLLSLTSLDLNETCIIELPESIGLLEKLVVLKLTNCKNLRKLPASIENLKNLRYFWMAKTALADLHAEIGALSSLKTLKMAKASQEELPTISEPSNHKCLASEENVQPVVLPESFSNLSSLQEMDASRWKISGKIPDSFERLSSLEILNLGYNNFYSLPSSLRGLSVLKRLLLPKCKELKVLPPLPSSLLWLNVADCSSLEHISDLSNLEYLEELQLTNCKRITDIPGLECLKSLRRLYMGGCNPCLPSMRRRLSKVALKHIRYLCVPGSNIPNWFIQELPRFSSLRNRDLKGVLIGVVLSLDQEQEDCFRKRLPAIVDVQAKIIRQNNAIYTTTLYLLGVPDTNEDQLYLCRFHEYNQLVFMLEDGDELKMAMREKPHFKGLNLKKHGIYLVYENDDDYDDKDDDLFDESQQSISRKLANFFRSL